jgi:hypothetical protein
VSGRNPNSVRMSTGIVTCPLEVIRMAWTPLTYYL